MIPTTCKRLIEVDFPIAAVSAHSAREKSIRHGHPSRLHLWWARRPLAAWRAVLLGCHLAHYLQKDFAAAVKADILIDDVQRTGFVHEIVESASIQTPARRPVANK